MYRFLQLSWISPTYIDFTAIKSDLFLISGAHSNCTFWSTQLLRMKAVEWTALFLNIWMNTIPLSSKSHPTSIPLSSHYHPILISLSSQSHPNPQPRHLSFHGGFDKTASTSAFSWRPRSMGFYMLRWQWKLGVSRPSNLLYPCNGCHVSCTLSAWKIFRLEYGKHGVGSASTALGSMGVVFEPLHFSHRDHSSTRAQFFR